MANAQAKTSNELTAGGKEQELTDLAAPLLTFDLGAESKRLRLGEHWLRDGRISKTLVKYSDFRIVLILMQAGTLMQEHQADARISIQVLSGRVQIQLSEKTLELSVGDLLVLEKCQPHDVKALEESAFLLSISWPHGDEQES
jgi:quercetin dioxygenase-like cupin family protein